MRTDVGRYVKANIKELCVSAAALTLTYYHYLFSANDRMDTIIKLVDSTDEFNDLELGRFGIVWLNRILGMRAYNPYLVSFLTLVTLVLAGGFFSYLLDKVTNGRCGRLTLVLPLIVFMSPCWVEQLYFSYQSFLVLLGALLLEVSVWLTEYGDRRPLYVLAAFMAFVAFSIYQAFVPLMLCLCVGVVLLRFSVSEDDPYSLSKGIFCHALTFAAALVLYFIVNGLLTMGAKETDYLNSQILWGTMPLPGMIQSVMRSIMAILTMEGLVDTLSYPLSAIVSAVMLLLCGIKAKDKGNIALMWVGWLCLQLTGFAMILVMGQRSLIRSELTTPVIVTINLVLASICLSQGTRDMRRQGAVLWSRWAVCLVAALCLFVNAGVSFRLIYTDDMRNQFDYSLTTQLIEDIRQSGWSEDEKVHVVFVGESDMVLNDACLEGDVIGRSLYAFNRSCGATNTIIRTVLTLHGLLLSDVTARDVVTAHDIAQGMPSYPQKGSVLNTGELIVVKLSDAYYYDAERLSAGVAPSTIDIDPMKMNNGHSGTLFCQVDNIATDTVNVQIRGFQIQRGIDASDVSSRVFVRNCTSGETYELNSAREQRIHLSKMFWRDKTSYDAGGFIALCPVSFFERNPSDSFEIVVMGTEGMRSWAVSTGVVVNKRMIDRMPVMAVGKEFMNYEFS